MAAPRAALDDRQAPAVESVKVVEIGCGSGAISLALAKALPGLGIVAADQSRMSCQLTEENAENLNLVR